MNYPVSNPLQILGDDSTYHSITKYSNISKIDIIPSKVYYTQRNVAEYSWSSRAQCAKNIMPEYQSCSLAVPLPRQGKFPALCNKLQTMSCTFLHVTALATNHIFHSQSTKNKYAPSIRYVQFDFLWFCAQIPLHHQSPINVLQPRQYPWSAFNRREL